MTVGSLIRILQMVPDKTLPVYTKCEMNAIDEANHVYMTYIDRQVYNDEIFVEKAQEYKEANSVFITNSN